MFTNLKATNEFRKIKKDDKNSSFVSWHFLRSEVSTEFEPLFLLLETMLRTKILEGRLSVKRDKIKWDKYWISFVVETTINKEILENMFLESDYTIKDNTFTFYIN